MDMTLVIVTLVSVALAIAMGVITWRLLQEERQRADARAAVLEQGLAESFHTHPPAAPATASFARTGAQADGAITPVSLDADDTDWLGQFPASAPPSTDTDTGVAADADADATAPFGRAAMFGQTVAADDDTSAASRRATAIMAVAAVMLAAVLAFWTISRLSAPAADPRTAAAAAAQPAAALELVSLRHTQQDNALTITGLVRNPRSGQTQERLTAVVFFFDRQGGFLASTRAPLDFRALAPGDESPFQLSAPAPPGVARYRVSFRREEGAIVPHVDRRPQEAS